jgi:D-inositol-3-phosphate glycosyltransferase
MRRIAVISYHSSPLLEPGAGDAGGMTVYVREVARSMAKLGIRTDIFTRSTTSRVEVTDIYPGVRVVTIPAGPPGEIDKAGLASHIGQFVDGIRSFAVQTRAGYELVHSHYWQSGIAGAELAAAWNAPLVHSNHTLAKVKNRFLPPGDQPEPASRLEGEARVISSAEILVTSTDDELEHLACLYGASHDRLKTIHPGVDHAMFSPGDKGAARAELGLGDEVVLAFVGRIQPLKGLDLAFRAVAQLLPALDRELKLFVVGGVSGPSGNRELAKLLELADELGISGSIVLSGPQPHQSTPLFYRAADAVVVCSYSESFGLTALEAQACGTPVVATDVGGLRHIVTDASSGYLVDTRDPADFAARLKTLLSDRDLQAAFSKHARESSARFDWERTSRELAELYECLITERLPEACTC